MRVDVDVAAAGHLHVVHVLCHVQRGGVLGQKRHLRRSASQVERSNIVREQIEPEQKRYREPSVKTCNSCKRALAMLERNATSNETREGSRFVLLPREGGRNEAEVTVSGIIVARSFVHELRSRTRTNLRVCRP